MGSAVDTLTAIVFLAILVLLAAPIVEIAVKNPRIFLELARDWDVRAFAEAPLRKSTSPRTVANDCKVEASRSDEKRLAA